MALKSRLLFTVKCSKTGINFVTIYINRLHKCHNDTQINKWWAAELLLTGLYKTDLLSDFQCPVFLWFYLETCWKSAGVRFPPCFPQVSQGWRSLCCVDSRGVQSFSLTSCQAVVILLRTLSHSGASSTSARYFTNAAASPPSVSLLVSGRWIHEAGTLPGFTTLGRIMSLKTSAGEENTLLPSSCGRSPWVTEPWNLSEPLELHTNVGSWLIGERLHTPSVGLALTVTGFGLTEQRLLGGGGGGGAEVAGKKAWGETASEPGG